MAVYLLPTVQQGSEACVAVQTAVYICGTAYTSIYSESSLGHLQMYWLYMDSKWMNLAAVYIECQRKKEKNEFSAAILPCLNSNQLVWTLSGFNAISVINPPPHESPHVR